MLLPIDKADMGLCKDIDSLEPFGKGNPKPIFSDKGVHIIKAAVLGKNRNVLKLTLKSKKNNYVNGIIFNNKESFNDIIESEFGKEEMQKLYNSYSQDIKLDIVYNIGINTFNGTSSVQLNIISFRKSK
jgi:single-stranded-DNA-specific exonuclease